MLVGLEGSLPCYLGGHLLTSAAAAAVAAAGGLLLCWPHRV
jgi:hypothetical protein